MPTVLLIDTSGPRYFQRRNGEWRLAAGPGQDDTVWVLINLPDEGLEVIDLPRLFGRDRVSFIERRLAAAHPESAYRVAHGLSGNMLKPGKVMLTGLAIAKEILGLLEALEAPIAGVWGMAALLFLMTKSLDAANLLLALPSEQELRILVVQNKSPLLTRCVHIEGESHAEEILLTRQYLENKRIFERGKSPPVLYLGDLSPVATRLSNAGLTLLTLPKGLAAKGEAGWLHPVFEKLVASPPCQLAPLSLRARYLGRNVRRAALGIAAATLLSVTLYGKGDFQAIIGLHRQELALRAEIQTASGERARLAELVQQSGTDPEMVRRATKFVAEEISVAPSTTTFFAIAARAIAAVPEARVKTLAFQLTAGPGGTCQQGASPLPDSGQPLAATEVDPAAASQRYAELQITVTLPSTLEARARSEARQRLTGALKGMAGVKLLQDPGTAARSTPLTNAVSPGSTLEDLWCVAVPWKPAITEGKKAL